MKNVLSMGFAGLILIVSSSVQAGGFWSVGGSRVSFDDGSDEVNPINGLLRLGYAFNEYIELGGEISVSIISDEISSVDFDVDTTFLFVKFNAPLDGGSKVYFMAGPTDVELTGSSGGFSVSADDSDTGFGIGIQVPAEAGAYYVFDYIRYFDDDGVDANAIGFSYMSYF